FDRQSLAPKLEEHSETIPEILFNLLEQIKLPLLLQNAEGSICYQNSAWHQHCNYDKEALLKDDKRKGRFLTAEELALQSFLFLENLEARKTANSTECYCPIGDQGFNSLFVDSGSPTMPNQLFPKFSLSNYPSTSTENIHEQILNNSYLNIQDENDLSWHYIRFPIELPVQNQGDRSSQKYLLVLGIQLEEKLSTQEKGNLEEVADVSEDGIRPSSDLNKLRRLQNEFMVSISHDLKSPLTAIIGLSSLLKEEKLGSLNSRQIRYLDLIYRGGRQLMGIVTDLLDITSLATGKLKLKWEKIELEKLCSQAYQQVVARLKAVHSQDRGLVLPQFNCHRSPEAEFAIADRLRLTQILMRLLENAIKSTPGSGEIGIRIEKWTEWIAIIVWDTGKGIAETFQKSLLEEMFEPDNFLTSPEKTTGLGLILAQQLAQSHGGDISFTSQVDRGSEFTLLLPVNNPHRTEETSDRHNHQSTLVLIVETSTAVIKDLTENLHRLGYHTAIARNHNEALYKATHLQPTKIILNQEMTKLAEQNILLALNSNAQTADIPLILMSKERYKANAPSFPDEQIFLSSQNKINPEILAEHFPSLTSQHYCPGKRLTMLRLCLTDGELNLTGSEIDLLFENPSFNLCHHIIEADSIEQAHMLARIWKIDTIIWDSSNLEFPLSALRSLVTFPNLAQIPIVTLDESTTAAANQFENLTVFPCLIPINEQNIAELMEVIQSAATAIDH
ncbi:MAG: hybrid sensor histidine kinase/response regulator, partial [Cyanobacteria bacterium P01_F01_bin.143]